MKIGVLAMQGAFREHRLALESCGCQVVEVRRPGDLEELDGLVIPGGESTTIGKLLNENGLTRPIADRAGRGMGIFGTCAGTILLAREIAGSDQPRLGLMDLTVQRNAYGRQVDSFETLVEVPLLGKEPVQAVFIRAPKIIRVGRGVEVLARHQGEVVLARQGKLLTATFHPELTPDLRLHRYFVSLLTGETGERQAGFGEFSGKRV